MQTEGEGRGPEPGCEAGQSPTCPACGFRFPRLASGRGLYHPHGRNNGDSHSYLPWFAQPTRGSQVSREKPVLPGFPPNRCIERDMEPNSREPRLTAMELDPRAGHAARPRAVR